MDKDVIRRRALELYSDEIQYAIARDDEVDLNSAREKAARRLGQEMDGQDMSPVWIGYVEGIARSAERSFEVDPTTGQLRFGDALRVRDLTFVPTPRARVHDWLALDARHEEKFLQHALARGHERDAIHEIVERMRAHGGDPTTLEACPDLFAEAKVA